MNKISRRKFVTASLVATAGVSGMAVAANFAKRYGLVPPDSGGIYGPGETLTYAVQRLLARHSLAREFPRNMISKVPFANAMPPLNDSFKPLQAGAFADWRLSIDGMVTRPTSYSLADLRKFLVRSQITEVVCEEGWSYVAEWIGTPLFEVLKTSGGPAAGSIPRVLLYRPRLVGQHRHGRCQHAQTLLAWAMNDGDLPVAFGGPLRLRVPRQLGYKSVKFLTRLMVTDSLKGFVSGLDPKSPNLGYA